MDKKTYVHGDMLKATEYTLLGKLPDPFLMSSGQRVSSVSDWRLRREEIRSSALNLLYGRTPPEPEFVDVEPICDYRYSASKVYRIHTGTRAHPLHFRMHILLPMVIKEKCPVIVDGDQCFARSEGYLEAALSKGIAWILFDRTEIAHDVQEETRGHGSIYETWPGLTCGALACWAWGYSRCVDALQQLDLPLDLDWIAFTGHSRGGKTVLLAATVDERIKYVSPNNSGCHGACSYRTVVTDQGDIKRRTERLEDMLKNLRHWMGDKLEPYSGREQDLPYDMHYFGALIAPRYYLQNEGMQDYWINPIGAWQNFMAVKECYRYLGCEDHAAALFRPGIHRHKLPDYAEFMDFMCRVREGKPIREHLTINPYPDIARNFDW